MLELSFCQCHMVTGEETSTTYVVSWYVHGQYVEDRTACHNHTVGHTQTLTKSSQIQSLQRKSQTKSAKKRTNKKVPMQSVHFGVSSAECRDKLMGAETNAPEKIMST